MAPEQAKGKPVDKRSDIWAFGCVLYEMLTGKRAFEGEDVSDTMANVLKREPDWDRLPGTTPPAVRLLLRRCLRKEKRQRLQDAAGVRIEIEDALSAPAGSASAVSQGRPCRALALGVGRRRGVAGRRGHRRSRRVEPEAVPAFCPTSSRPVDSGGAGGRRARPARSRRIAVSPDGAHLVYVATRRGVQQLHLRSIDSLESKALVGTEGAIAPFFSPDSQWMGFFAEGKLKKIPVTGGASQIVCDAGDSLGGSWAPNDVIYFAPGGFSGLWQVSATGGAPQPFTKLQEAGDQSSMATGLARRTGGPVYVSHRARG